MWLWVFKICGSLGPKNRIRQQFCVIIRIDRDKKGPGSLTEIWKSQFWIRRIEMAAHISYINLFNATG
jgi:hypothetical protein